MKIWGVKCRMRPGSSPIWHSTHKTQEQAQTQAALLLLSGVFGPLESQFNGQVEVAVFEEIEDLEQKDPPTNREPTPYVEEVFPLEEYRCAVPFCRRPATLLYDGRLWCEKDNGNRPAKKLTGVFKAPTLEE